MAKTPSKKSAKAPKKAGDKKRKKKALPQLLSLVHTLLAGNDMAKAAKALRKGVEEEVSCFRVAA